MSPRILIAEDDVIQGAVLRSALRNRGYQAEVVTDGLEALRRMRTSRYDVALLDYHMPVVDGLAAARLLHDFMRAEDRPRLIAITAAVEGLSQKELTGGGTSFDAVVSKGAGLPALLSAIDENLASAAAQHAAIAIKTGRESVRQAIILRRRRFLNTLAALPALGMAAVFLAGFVGAALSVQRMGSAVGSAQLTAALSTDTAALVGAMQDTEASQRTYLATGSDAHRMQFEADAQRVDQLLVAATPLAADGAPGLGAAMEPQAVIEPRLRLLAQEAETRGAAGPAQKVSALSIGHGAADSLRAWAASVVGGSQQVLIDGLRVVHRNMLLVLTVLAFGVIQALWTATKSLRRPRRRATDIAPHGQAGAWRHAVPAGPMVQQISGPG